MKNGIYWLSSKRATFIVNVQDNIVVGGAPISRRFLGQHIKRLLNWFHIDNIKRLDQTRRKHERNKNRKVEKNQSKTV